MVGLITQRQSIAQVCGPSHCTQNRIVNAIAAHKDELKRLIENLSGDVAVSGMTFVALLDAYITRLDTNCSDISAGVSPHPPQINRRINMEPTLTQNCALYYVQHRTPKRRPALFREFRVAARRQALLSDSPHATNFSSLYRHHRNNGR
jgi:hypothetical protein